MNTKWYYFRINFWSFHRPRFIRAIKLMWLIPFRYSMADWKDKNKNWYKNERLNMYRFYFHRILEVSIMTDEDLKYGKHLK